MKATDTALARAPHGIRRQVAPLPAFLLEAGVGAGQALVDLVQGLLGFGLAAGAGEEGGLARQALQARQAGGGVLIGPLGLLDQAQALIDACELQGSLGVRGWSFSSFSRIGRASA